MVCRGRQVVVKEKRDVGLELEFRLEENFVSKKELNVQAFARG